MQCVPQPGHSNPRSAALGPSTCYAESTSLPHIMNFLTKQQLEETVGNTSRIYSLSLTHILHRRQPLLNWGEVATSPRCVNEQSEL